MKKQRNLFQTLGFLLILLSMGLLLGKELLGMYHRGHMEKITEHMEALLPNRTVGGPEEYANSDMPVLQVDGEDYAALLRVPAFGVTLPVAGEWNTGALLSCPHRFWGSVYDHTLIIGGSGQKGQFDFCGRLDLGNKITVTDMTGAQFSYEVARIDRRRQADMQTFQEVDSDLILFVRDDATLDYIIVRCAFVPTSEIIP